MTATVSESKWRKLAQRLADDISAAGKMYTTEWRAAVENVPRHVFVPHYYTDDQNGHTRSWILHEPTNRDSIERWLDLVYSRTTLVTQVADFADRGTQAAVSSSTKPDLMIRMLETLDVVDGMNVLEIGTGTGYNAALLSHRLGAENVYSVDVDPHLVDDARDRLDGLGYTAATLTTVDGIEGLPEHAPYDRIIATCALFGFPAAWITQLRPDGLALVHIEGPLGAGNLLAMRHTAPNTVQGRFLPWWGCFMRRRATAGPTVGTPRPPRTGAAPTTRTTTVDPAQLDGGARFPFLAQLHLPHGVFRSMWCDDGGTVTELRCPDGSWSEVIREPNTDGRYQVREAGPTPLWGRVEAAWEQWTNLGAPAWHEFGLTATSHEHTVWFDTPDGPHWPLPLPEAT